MRYSLLLVIALAALLVGCAAEQPVQRQDTAGTPATATTSGEEPAVDSASESDTSLDSAVVVISDMKFRAHSVTIKAGESVGFVNKDSFSHTATGDNWDTGSMGPGQTESITFDEPGTYEYVCRFHPGMRGEIIVE